MYDPEFCKMETADLGCESDDSDDLPDLFALTSPEPSDIKEGDIVWAKYRQYYWPSLIRKVFKKERKASLWYLDSPRKCFKVSFKYIHSFKDRAFSLNAQKEASESPIKALHEKVLSWTLCYIQRRGQGHKDDPGDFFDRKKHYLSLYDLKAAGKLTQSAPSDVAKQTTVSFLRNSLNDGYNESSEEESIPESDEEDLKVTKFCEEIEVTDEDYCPEERVNAIVDCIISGKVDKYLFDIFSRKIPSQRQTVFDEYVKSKDRKLLSENSPTVMFKDREKYVAICKHLQSFYESVAEKGSRDQFNYVMYVWFPDAVDKAVAVIESNINGVDVDDGVDPTAKRQLFADSNGEKHATNENEEELSIFDVEKNLSTTEKKLPTLKQSPKKCPGNKMNRLKKITKIPQAELKQSSKSLFTTDLAENTYSETLNLDDIDLTCANNTNMHIENCMLKPVQSRKGRRKKKNSTKMARNMSISKQPSNSAEEDGFEIQSIGPTRKKARLPRKLSNVEPSTRVMRSHRSS